jgi:3,4-dihydroxy-2-butanone 4-phosphate synthase
MQQFTLDATFVQDDFERENEGDFIGAAATATAESVALMLRHCTGVVCVPILPDRAKALGLPLMVPDNEDPFKTAFTVTVDCLLGTTTGISASDRAATIRALATSDRPRDFSRPGHVFPLIARTGGVLSRGGHTEAGVDMCALASHAPVSFLCELCDHFTFEMLRLPQIVPLAAKLGLPLTSIAELQRFRLRREPLLRHVTPAGVCSSLSSGGSLAFESIYGGVDNWYVVASGALQGNAPRASGTLLVTVVFHTENMLLAPADPTAHALAVAARISLLGSERISCITVHVFGPVDSNVPGNKRCKAASSVADSTSPALNADTAEDDGNTAYPGLYPVPHVEIGQDDSWPSMAHDSSSDLLHSPSIVCDRVSAEIAQCVAFALNESVSPHTASMFSSAALGGTAEHTPPGIGDIDQTLIWTPEPDLVASCSSKWPRVQLCVFGECTMSSRSMPRLWEFGLQVDRVSILSSANSH